MEYELAAAVRGVRERGLKPKRCASPTAACRRESATIALAGLVVKSVAILKAHPVLLQPFLDEFREGRSPPNAASVRAVMTTVMEQVANRWDDLEANESLCSVDESDTEDLDQWQPTRAEVEFVKRVFFPALFAPRPKPSVPTESPPESAERIAVMAERLAAGEDLYHPADAKVEGRKLRTQPRMNGAKTGGGGLRVIGWGE